MRIEPSCRLTAPNVPLRRYVHTYTLTFVKMTRTAFAILFGVHVPEWTRTVWVSGTQYHLIDRQEEIAELEHMMAQNEEPLTTVTDRKGGTSR